MREKTAIYQKENNRFASYIIACLKKSGTIIAPEIFKERMKC